LTLPCALLNPLLACTTSIPSLYTIPLFYVFCCIMSLQALYVDTEVVEQRYDAETGEDAGDDGDEHFADREEGFW